jgi:hypothetical protein
MYRRRILLLVIFAAVCTSALSASRRSRANDTDPQDAQCEFECEIEAARAGQPISSTCYDACVGSREGQGCAISHRAP